jgi:secondary thiamine-phosphate synthase enzyme
MSTGTGIPNEVIQRGLSMAEVLRVSTQSRKQVVDLTPRIEEHLRHRQVKEGICTLFVTHTTAALTTGEIGEGTEQDFLEIVERMIPRIDFRHAHDPGHAWSHMASSILGPSLMMPISAGKLVLGTWQAVMLVELDGPREREVYMTILPAASGAAS